MELLLVIAYSALLSAWFYKSPSFAGLGLSRGFLVGVFLLKATLGIAYGMIYRHWYQTGDAWRFFDDSRIIYEALPERPLHYLQLTFGYSPDGSVPEAVSDLYERMFHRWRTKEYTMVRVNSVLNLFSFGHFYVNTVLLSAAVLFGLTRLYRLFAERFPAHSRVLMLSVFLLPATLFWCSGVHKDAVTLFALCTLLYQGDRLVQRPQRGNLIGFLAAAFLLGITRSYVLLFLLPALPAYAWSLRRRAGAPETLGAFALAYLALFVAAWLMQAYGPVPPLDRMVLDHEWLMARRGNTHLPMRPLQADWGDFAAAIPQALDHTWIKPFTRRPEHVFQAFSAFDNALQFLALLLCAILARGRRLSDPLVLLCLLFTSGLLITEGILVPSLGAIVRYKSALLPFLFSALFVLLPERHLKGVLHA